MMKRVSGRTLGFLEKQMGCACLTACVPLQCLQNPSSDIRLVAEKMIWWANKDPLPPLDPQAIKPILKALLDNTKDKNTVVRAYSDQAIVNLLKMRQGEEVFQVGARSACLPGGVWAFVLQVFCATLSTSHPALPACTHECGGTRWDQDWSDAGNDSLPVMFTLLLATEPTFPIKSHVAPKPMEHASRAPRSLFTLSLPRGNLHSTEHCPSSPRGGAGVVSLVFLDASHSEVTTHFCLWWEKPEAPFLTVSSLHLPTVPL